MIFSHTPTIVSIAMPLVLFGAFRIIFHGKAFEMDYGPHPNDRGSFFGIFTIYRRQANVILGVGLFLSIYLLGRISDQAVVLLMSSALYAMLFNLWLTMAYESYLGAKYPKNIPKSTPSSLDPRVVVGPTNYTATKYAITMSLGISSAVLFVCGIISLVSGSLK